MAIAIPNAALGVASGTILGQPWANVIGLKMPTNTLIDQSVANDVGNRIRAAYVGIVGSLSTNWTMNKFILQDLRTTNSASWEYVFTAFSGTDAGNPMPSHIAAVASHKTGFRGKSYNGRTYLAGLTEVANDGFGKIAPGYVTSLQGLFTSMRTNLDLVAGGGWKQAVVSRKLLEANEVLSTTVNNTWDHQDRRKG